MVYIMFNKKIVIALLGILLVVAAIGISDRIALKKDDNTPIELDYTNIDMIVDEALKEVPEVETILLNSRNKTMDYATIDVFNVQKQKFRLAVQNKLIDKKITEDIEVTANEFVNNYLNALSIAEEVYGVTVSQEEVTKYIDEHIANVITEEKEKYAKALDLTLFELDYNFDRDFYVLDTLWQKLTPVLMEKHPQENGEEDNRYLERIKTEFYSQKKI